MRGAAEGGLNAPGPVLAYSAFSGACFLTVTVLVADDISALVTLAVFVCVSTEAETFECQAHSADAADMEMPNAAANARNVFIVVLLLR
jgi:hypothetical protein